jgi:hypothetical protein
MRITRVSPHHKHLPMLCSSFTCSLEPGGGPAPDVVIVPRRGPNARDWSAHGKGPVPWAAILIVPPACSPGSAELISPASDPQGDQRDLKRHRPI